MFEPLEKSEGQTGITKKKKKFQMMTKSTISTKAIEKLKCGGRKDLHTIQNVHLCQSTEKSGDIFKPKTPSHKTAKDFIRKTVKGLRLEPN